MTKRFRCLLFIMWASIFCAGLARANAMPLATTATAVINGRQLAEVHVGDRVVARIGSTAGGLPPAARAAVVAERLNVLLEEGLSPEEISFRRVGTYWAVTARDQIIVTVDSSAARARDAEPRELAFVWANNIRQAIGGRPLGTLDYWMAGGEAQVARTEYGVASWYGPGFQGRRTANGEVFEQGALTAAHRTLPFGTRVLVTNVANGRSVLVRINDRGPWVGARIIDLSRRAAQELGLVDQGIGRVRLDIIR